MSASGGGLRELLALHGRTGVTAKGAGRTGPQNRFLFHPYFTVIHEGEKKEIRLSANCTASGNSQQRSPVATTMQATVSRMDRGLEPF